MILSDKFILLVDDDDVAAELMLLALAAMRPAPKVVHVRDGVEALDFLHCRGAFRNRAPQSPAMVLLDVKMPRLDGLDVLRQLKRNAHLQPIPVVMLSASKDEYDVRTSYEIGANAYVVKPVDQSEFTFVLQQLEAFWINVNQPPPDRRSLVDDLSLS